MKAIRILSALALLAVLFVAVAAACQAPACIVNYTLRLNQYVGFVNYSVTPCSESSIVWINSATGETGTQGGVYGDGSFYVALGPGVNRITITPSNACGEGAPGRASIEN